MTSSAQAERRAMYLLAANRDAAEGEVEEMAGGFVVVAGDVDDLGAFARLAEDFLHDVVMRLMPVPAAPQLPAVDDVADEVEVIGFGAPQELEQTAGLAAGRAEVGVRDPDGPESLRGGRLLVHRRAQAGARLSGSVGTQCPPPAISAIAAAANAKLRHNVKLPAQVFLLSHAANINHRMRRRH